MGIKSNSRLENVMKMLSVRKVWLQELDMLYNNFD